MCRALRVSPSGYYAWLKRPESSRAKQDRRLVAYVRAAYARSHGTYGVRRLHAELAGEGIDVGRDRVRRLMRRAGLEAKPRRRRAWRPAPASMIDVPNVLARRFTVERPNAVWVADTTEFATGEGTLYVAAVLDLYARRVIGWAASSSMHRSLAIDALTKALHTRGALSDLIHHSDRGSQYTSAEYRALLDRYGVTASYSGRGQCLDNAPMESFFGTLKDELVHRSRFATHAEARRALARYVEVFYNHQRRHSALRYRTPTAHEAAYHQARTCAA
ncbi:MAG TPA: IS3 family transposase [Rhodothermales bacterium]|nr:IS3 family transposase [Rhodothermales bacterium]